MDLFVVIGGEPYRVSFTMGAWRDMESRGLTLRDLPDRLQGEDNKRLPETVVALLISLVRAGGSVPGISEEELLARMARVEPREAFPAILVLNAAIRDGLRMQLHKASEYVKRDPLLEQLDREHGDARGGLTWRHVAGWGLIAGISLTEQEHMTPGLVMDLFLSRQDYDDVLHHIKRKKPDGEEVETNG